MTAPFGFTTSRASEPGSAGCAFHPSICHEVIFIDLHGQTAETLQHDCSPCIVEQDGTSAEHIDINPSERLFVGGDFVRLAKTQKDVRLSGLSRMQPGGYFVGNVTAT